MASQTSNLRLSPGDQLKIIYTNDLPVSHRKVAAISPCMDMTNFALSRPGVSPDRHPKETS